MSASEREYLDKYLESLKDRTARDMAEDEFFERFCAEQILKSRDLDVAELASGMVRGKGDGGVDSIYLFANGKLVQEGSSPTEYKKQQHVKLHLVLLQATRTPHFDEEMIRKMGEMSAHLLDLTHNVDDYVVKYNKSLLTAVKRFRDWWAVLIPQLPELQVTFYNASKAEDEPHKNVRSRAAELEQQIKQLYSCECTVEFVNAKALLDLARRSRRKPITLRFAAQLSSDKMGNAYVCLVPIPDYVKFLTDEEGQRREYILAPNVRGYLGENEVNNDIYKTLAERQDKEFWWLNNGITIVTTKIHASTRELTLEEPRIVNGLQTSRVIYNYSRTANAEKDPRHIVVRVIEASDKHIFNQVLKSTNSQTKIGKVYFHSIEDIHEKIEMALPAMGLYYERVKNQYFDEEREREKILTLPYMIQALIAIVLRSPEQARGRPGSFGEREYSRLFRAKDKPELYGNVAKLMKRVEQFLRTHKPTLERNDQYNLKFYVALFASTMILQDSNPYRSRFSQLKVERADDNVLEEALKHVAKEYKRLSRNDDPDAVAKGNLLAQRIKAALSKRFPSRRR